MELEPVELLPFKLHDISDFVNQEHPIIHPSSPEYKRYWDEQIKYCIYGKWGHDYDKLTNQGGWRWMPPNLYFYINMCVIDGEGDFGTDATINPMLRDVEWYLFYAIMECEGFAGFDEDENISCFRPLKKVKTGDKLKNYEKHFLKKYDKYLRKPNGEYKDYVDAREYMYKTHDTPLGKPLFLNECQDLLVLSTRRIGKSSDFANGVVGHEFCLNGARSLDDFLNKRTKSVMVVGSGQKEKSSDFLSKFSKSYNYIRKNIGAYHGGGVETSGVFYKKTEGSLSADSRNTFTNEVAAADGGRKGPGSKIVHVSYHVNPSAGVGHGARKMIVEETGLLGRWKKVHAENQAVMTRETRFGWCAYIGTGGQVEKTEEVQDAFENPEAYNILSFEDRFSKVDRKIGLFIPCYYRKNLYRDENGNTDIKAAFEDEIAEREQKKKESELAYEGHCISFPIVPQEMFLANAGNPFFSSALDDRITELTSGEWKKRARVGDIEYTNKQGTEARFILDKEGKLTPVIRHRQEKDIQNKKDEVEGAFVVYEPPVMYRPHYADEHPLYIVAYDPVLKEDGGSSLCVATVFKVWDYSGGDDEIQFNIVAERVWRFKNTDKNHDQVFKLAALYNAKILPEMNIDDINRFARGTNRLHMLEPEPYEALGKVFENYKRKFKAGVTIAPGQIPRFEKTLVDLIDVNVLGQHEREYLGQDGIEIRQKKMIEECYSLRFLEELKYYNRDANFDYVSAMMLISIWVKQLDLRPVNPQRREQSKTRVQEMVNFARQQQRRTVRF